MKKGILMVLVLMVLVVNIGCTSGSELKEKQDVDILKANVPYSIRANMSIVLKKQYVEDILGKADITKKIETKTYEIRKKDDSSLIIVTYDNESGRLIDVWRLEKLYEIKDFEEIVVGKSTLDDVEKIDPFTSFFEKSKENGISEHRLINDEVVVISYIRANDSWQVDDVAVEKDPVGFSTIISPDYFNID